MSDKRIPRVDLPEGVHLDTLAVREGLPASAWGENSEALFLTSSFCQPGFVSFSARGSAIGTEASRRMSARASAASGSSAKWAWRRR